MTEILKDLLLILLPSIGTGFLTFLITKYQLSKNQPLENYKIAYNRIYYPLWKLIKDNANQEVIIADIEIRKMKYRKYFYQTTLRLVDRYQKNISKVYKKRIYKKIESDILENAYMLRKILYYPQSNWYKNFWSMDFDGKIKFLLSLMFLVLYIFLLIAILPIKWIQNFIICVIIVLLFLILVVVTIWMLRYICIEARYIIALIIDRWKTHK